MVGWDNSYKYAMLKEREISQIRELNSKLGNFSVDIQKVLIDLTKEWYDFYGFDLPDPITMAIALENSIIEESQDCHVIVDTRDGITRGQTIVDYFDVEGKNQNVRVVTKSSNKKFMSLLLDLLR
jgi:purine nucleosidase